MFTTKKCASFAFEFASEDESVDNQVVPGTGSTKLNGEMARITVEDCLDHESNRFSLVRLATARAKQLLAGKTPVTNTRGNKAIVSALREIADGKVRYRDSEEGDDNSESMSDLVLES